MSLHINSSLEKNTKTQQNTKFILEYTKGKELNLNKGKKKRTDEKIELNQHM